MCPMCPFSILPVCQVIIRVYSVPNIYIYTSINGRRRRKREGYRELSLSVEDEQADTGRDG